MIYQLGRFLDVNNGEVLASDTLDHSLFSDRPSALGLVEQEQVGCDEDPAEGVDYDQHAIEVVLYEER